MAEAFCGKWKIDPSSVKGAEEYSAAVGHPDATKEIQAMKVTEVTLKDNVLTAVTIIEGKEPRVDVATLGKEDEIQFPGGPKMLSKTRVEGGRIVSDMYLGDKLFSSAVRYIKGDRQVMEITGNGKTMSFELVKA